jgi:hypothetical protein
MELARMSAWLWQATAKAIKSDPQCQSKIRSDPKFAEV